MQPDDLPSRARKNSTADRNSASEICPRIECLEALRIATFARVKNRGIMSDDLRETLEQLHQQLAAADNLDADTVERLRTTMDEVRATLEKRQAPDEPPAGRSDWLTETAQHFEESHPTLAGTITRLVDLLGQAGI